MKAVPHSHPGQLELCYDQFCTRVTVSEEVGNLIGSLFAGALFLAGVAAFLKALE